MIVLGIFAVVWQLYILGFMVFFGWRMYVTWTDGIYKSISRPTYETPLGAIVWPMSLWKMYRGKS